MKLLSSVDTEAHNGFGFHGCFLRAGAWVTWPELHPTRDYPEIPVLLEYSKAPAYGEPGKRRADALYVLWRWVPELHQWREIGRAASFAWEWAVDFRPLAIRALTEGRGTITAEPALDLAEIAGEIGDFLDKRLDILKPADRERILGILHDEFATRFSA